MGRNAGLTAGQLLDLADGGAGADAASRGRLLVQAAVPGRSSDELDRLSLGGRDAWILALRCGTFGEILPARISCPDCGQLLTVKVPHEEVARQPPPPVPNDPPVARVELDGLLVEARSPDAAVLAAAAACPDVAAARTALIRGCVSAARRTGEALDPAELDEDVLARIGDAIVMSDPQAEVVVTMTCAACRGELSGVFDVADFFWREISAAAVQLLDEVHQLAIGYGWSEDQVLSLPSRRRREYVERLTGE